MQTRLDERGQRVLGRLVQLLHPQAATAHHGPSPTAGTAAEAGAAPSLDALAEAAELVGLRVDRVRLDARTIARRAARDAPALGVLEIDGAAQLVMLLDRAMGRVRIWTDAERRPRWVRTADLRPSHAQDWLVVQAAAPCAPDESHAGDEPTAPTPLGRLLAIVRPDRSDIVGVAVFAVAIGALQLATPLAVQALVNFVAFGGAIAPIVVLSLLLALGLGGAAALAGLQAWIVEMLQRRIFVRMVGDLAHRLPRVHRSVYERWYGPELVNRFFDVMTVQKMSSLLLLDGLGVVLGVLVGLVVLAFYHPVLLAFDLLIVIAVALAIMVLGRAGVRTAIDESRAKYSVASWLEDVARNPVTFKTPGASRYVLQRADALTRDYVMARRAHYRVLFRQIVGMLALQVAASVALLGIGGALVVRGELTLGQLVAAELIVTYVVGALAKMGKHFESYYDLMAAVDKLGGLLDLPLEQRSGDDWSQPPAARGASLRLRELVYALPSGYTVLNGLSLDALPGDRIGIAGPGGSGKSTLAEILFGLRAPTAGLVEIDGIELRALRPAALRERVALIVGEEVFAGTIRDNLTLGRACSAEALHEALRRTGLQEEIAALRDGLDTRLIAEGAPLSEGQVHRLMLARAILGAPRLVVVDSALELMPLESLERVMDVLVDSRAPWTLIIISNRREVLDRCNRVVRLGAESVADRSPAA